MTQTTTGTLADQMSKLLARLGVEVAVDPETGCALLVFPDSSFAVYGTPEGAAQLEARLRASGLGMVVESPAPTEGGDAVEMPPLGSLRSSRPN